jgi:glucose uptake protein
MILPQTYTSLLLLMILGAICWGAWANMFKRTRNWRFELFYLDFAFGTVVAAVLLGLTAGSLGFDGFTFIDSVVNTSKRLMLFVFLAGVVFNIGNMLFMASLSVAGMTVAFFVAVGAGTLGSALAGYVSQPKGDPLMLFLGCAVLLGTVIVAALAFRSMGLLEFERLAQAGRVSTRRTVPMRGVVLAFAGGLIMTLSTPLLSIAQSGEAAILLTPYATALVFTLGILITTPIFSMFFMNLPVQGDPVEFTDYFKGDLVHHLYGWLGGMIWSAGAVALLVATSVNAVAETSFVPPGLAFGVTHAYPLVAALCGILAWREFRGADMRARALLILTLVLFLCGLALVSTAPYSGHHG